MSQTHEVSVMMQYALWLGLVIAGSSKGTKRDQEEEAALTPGRIKRDSQDEPGTCACLCLLGLVSPVFELPTGDCSLPVTCTCPDEHIAETHSLSLCDKRACTSKGCGGQQSWQSNSHCCIADIQVTQVRTSKCGSGLERTGND